MYVRMHVCMHACRYMLYMYVFIMHVGAYVYHNSACDESLSCTHKHTTCRQKKCLVDDGWKNIWIFAIWTQWCEISFSWDKYFLGMHVSSVFYVCVCVYVCVYIHTYIHACICFHTYTHIKMYMRIYIHFFTHTLFT